ncbi:energy-coupling factor ABC transporter ATP-binding protein [Lactovum miscens]|uniref:Energy-coupling factor transport system ATP-binding protein n=1 Tax=Lactovum miscens TaxID=190387 RepID=A0A841C9L9_9LACT|nr:energy-coupling factor ABC transporter ATP-binding protein [Lactovum miscens]MBB5888418.1 energy-coupling factor transport system ATP-binding protein [Lactovum miscens]
MTKVLEISDLNYRYEKNQEEPTLSDLSFDVNVGEWLAIIGQNGSGKSTTARIIDGLLEPEAGIVKICGETLNRENVWDLRRKIGMVFQNPDNQFVGATVEDDVAFGLENQGISREEMLKRVEEALGQVNMLDFKTKEPARLSGGQKQRVAIAGVIALRPQIIILDEATSMLDPTGHDEIMQVIREIKDKYNLTVISITHDLEEASHADRILVMQQGQIVRNSSPSQLFSEQTDLIEFGLDLPFSSSLAHELHQHGFDLPATYLTDDELVEAVLKNLN